MSVIKVRCTDQVLAYENTPVIASGGLDENFVAFTFCSQWNGYEKTAVFWRSEDEVYHQVLDKSDTCPLPPEVTTDDGVIWLGAFGVDATGRQRTSEVLSYRIVKGAITTDTKPSEPTPEIYTQILAELKTVRELAAATKAQEEEFENAMTTAHAQHVEDVAGMQAQHVADVEAARLAYEQRIQDQIVAGLVPDASITSGKIASGAVTSDKLAGSAVTSAKIQTGAVTSLKIASNAVTLAKIASGVLEAGNISVPADLSALFDADTSNVEAVLYQVAELCAKIQTGSYNGTGTKGSQANGNTLTFDFTPQVVIIGAEPSHRSNPLIFLQGSATTRHVSDAGPEVINAVWSGNSLTWYASDAGFQHNTSGQTYNYAAIG